MADARVASLHRYPVKACAAEDLTSAEVREDGLLHDRWLAVVVGDAVVTQRQHARLATVRPTLDDASLHLSVAYDGPGGPAPAGGEVALEGPAREVTIFGQPVHVVEQAPDLSAWFADVLDAPAVLVAAPPSSRRASPGLVSGPTALADECPVSLHAQASVDALNDRLAEIGHHPLPGERFRANVVLDGLAPHAEDEAGGIALGDVRLDFAQLDERCVVTTVDQRRGERDGPEPIRTLSTYRRTPGGGVAFGIHAVVRTPGTVRVGDAVTIAPRG